MVTLYLAAIVAANLSVTYFGPVAIIPNAFLLIGLDLTARDYLHDKWSDGALWRRMFALIATGGALSYALNADAGPIALASCAAFMGAGIVDAVSYSMLGRESRLVRMNGSNVFSAMADSIIFPTLAFGVWMPGIIAGQWLAKVAGGALWSLVLTRDDR